MTGPPNLDAGFNSLNGEDCTGDGSNGSPPEHAALGGHPHECTDEDSDERAHDGEDAGEQRGERPPARPRGGVEAAAGRARVRRIRRPRIHQKQLLGVPDNPRTGGSMLRQREGSEWVGGVAYIYRHEGGCGGGAKKS